MKKFNVSKILKTCGIVLGILLYTCFCFLLGFVRGGGDYDDLTASTETISASADEATTVAAEPDLTTVNTGWNAADYPTANLIPYPYSFETRIIQGLTYTVQSDGSIRIKGTSTGYSSITLSSKNVFENGKNYCIGGYVDGIITALLQVRYTVNNADRFYAYYGNPLLWEENFVFQTFFLVGASEAGKEVDITIYPMLNAGETAYPYQPPFDLIWKHGYKVGYDNGYNVGRTDGYDTGYGYGKEDGYKEGYETGYNEGNQAGLETAERGFWNDAGVVLTYTYNGLPYFYTFLSDGGEITYLRDGIDFSFIYTYLQKLNRTTATNLKISLTFSPYVERNFFHIGWIGPGYLFQSSEGESVVYTLSTIGEDRSITNRDIRFVYDDTVDYYKSELREGDLTTSWQIAQLSSFSINKASDSNNLRVFSYQSNYTAGYNAGYNTGWLDGADSTQEGVYNKGYQAGLTVGYNDGFNVASDGGGFKWIVSSVQNFLDVDFFGDFGVGEILLLMVGLGLVKLFLKFFAGG